MDVIDYHDNFKYVNCISLVQELRMDHKRILFMKVQHILILYRNISQTALALYFVYGDKVNMRMRDKIKTQLH